MKKILVIGAAGLVALLIIYYFFIANPVLSQVGSITITKNDSKFRNKVIQAQDPNEKRDIGLHQLTEAALNAEILRRNGHVINRDVLVKEAERIEKTTLMPEKLREIKKIFGNDYESYLNDYVLPVYANRVIYFEFFLHDQKIQYASLFKAHEILKEILSSGGNMDSVEKKHGLKSAKAWFSVQFGRQWIKEKNKELDETSYGMQNGMSEAPAPVRNALQSNLQNNSASQKMVTDIFSKLKPGQVFDQPIDAHETWEIVKLLKKEKNRYMIQVLTLPKEDFESWYQKEKESVRQQNVSTAR
jgi:hypothetical protein